MEAVPVLSPVSEAIAWLQPLEPLRDRAHLAVPHRGAALPPHNAKP